MQYLDPSSETFKHMSPNIIEDLNYAKNSSERGDSNSTKFWIECVQKHANEEGITLNPQQKNALVKFYSISIQNELPELYTRAEHAAQKGDVFAFDLWGDSIRKSYIALGSPIPDDLQLKLRSLYTTARTKGIDKQIDEGFSWAQKGNLMLAKMCIDKVGRFALEAQIKLSPEQESKKATLAQLINAGKKTDIKELENRILKDLLSPNILSKLNSELLNQKIPSITTRPDGGKIGPIQDSPQVPIVAVEARKQPVDPQKILDGIANLGNVGTEADVELLKSALRCFNPQILAHLADAGYKISIARNNIADATDNVRGRKVGNSGVINDYKGINLIREGSKEILVKSFYEDGNLRIDFASLLNEIGHALWVTDFLSKNSPEKSFESIHEKEKNGFDNQQLHAIDQFKAATFLLFAINPDKLKSQFPKTYEFYAKQNLPSAIIDDQIRLEFYRGMFPKADLSLDSELENLFIRSAKISDIRQKENGEGESLVMFIAGEKRATKLIARQLGDELIIQRTGAAPYSADEGFIHVTKDSTNDLENFFNVLKSSRGAILYIDDVNTFSPDSGFMQEFAKFCENHNGWCHLVISCSTQESIKFHTFLPENPRMLAKVEELNPDQVTKHIEKFAAADGMVFTAEAAEALVPFIKRSLTIDESFKLWVDIKDSHANRILSETSIDIDSDDFRKFVTDVTAQDISKSVVANLTSPIERLDQMIGLKNVKDKIHELVAGVKLNKYLQETGQPTHQQRRLNFVWPGNPGTGKTTVARLVAEIFYAEEIIECNNFIEISAPELIEKGASYAIQKFKENQGGVIFIDEFHQLDPSNNPKGKEIIDLLIPMLTSKEWEKTAFISAGYKKKINNMMRADEGLFSRLEVIEFNDYTRDELEQIARKELASKRLNASDQVLSALMDRVEKMQKSSPYPANARNVVKTIEQIVASQRSRLEKLIRDGGQLSAETIQEIIEEDVVIQAEISPEDVLKEINETISGNKKFKELMTLVYGLVQRNKQLGRDIGADIPMAIAIDGQSGTGKTTMARLAGKFYHALGLLPNSTLVETPGSQMVGGFVGNSSAIAVDDKFEEAYGGVLFIDEVSSMTAALEFSKQAIKQLITNMVDPDNRVLVVVADYPREMDMFMGFDGGVAPRFKHRVTAEVMSLEVANELFHKVTADKYTFEDGSSQVIERYLAQVVAIPQFASGRDINTLSDYIAAAQVRKFQSLISDSQTTEIATFDWKLITNQMLEDAFKELIEQVNKRPNRGSSSFVPRGVPLSFDRNRDYEKPTEEVQTRKEIFTEEENKTRLAIVKINESYADMANSRPNEFQKLLEDPNSEYYVKLGNELGTTADDAFNKIKQIELKLSAILDERDPEKELRFDYDCPFCGGVNSSKCHYFSNSQPVKPEGFLYSNEWLVTHSRKPPYYVELN